MEVDSHIAKSRALERCCDDLRLAITADMDNLSFKLCGEGLIPREVRDTKEAPRMVSTVESKLGYDESVWEKLIKVLNDSNSQPLADKLIQKLRVELGKNDAPGVYAPRGVQGAREFCTVPNCEGCSQITLPQIMSL